MTPTKPAPTLAEYLSAEAWAEREFPAPAVRDLPQIATDRILVPIVGEELHPIWWRGKQWAVTEYGIERLNGRYVIEASRLADHVETHPWPRHMAKKAWVDVDEFATAWVIALALHGHSAKVTPQQMLAAFAQFPPVET